MGVYKIRCKICRRAFGAITAAHVRTHGITVTEYANEFRGSLTAVSVAISRGRRKMPQDRKSLADRFWEKVRRGGSSECWCWTGSGARTGRYGSLAHPSGGFIQAHHASWELHRGMVPDGLLVLHTCDNGLCVNPAHLFLGTQADNMQDMVQKGRHGRGYKMRLNCHRGECNPRAVLTEAIVREAKRRNELGERPCDIQRVLGIKKNTFFHIAHGRQWTHVLV